MPRLMFSLIAAGVLFAQSGVACAAKAKCPELSVYLEGTSTFMGAVYKERLTMHRVSGGNGYDGKWLIDEFEQQIDYPWVVSPAIPPSNTRVDMGLGMWMNNFSRQVGPRTVLVTSTAGNYQLDVVGGKVGLAATGRFSGSVTGDEMTFKFDPSSSTEPVLKGRIIRGGRAEDLELSISVMNDIHGGKFCYSADTPATLKLVLEARVTPADRASNVEWSLPEIPGSVRIVEPVDSRGPYITVTYKLLPEQNSSFGEKTITARIRSGACKAEDSKKIKIFYPSTAENNLDGRDPNWFYYWGQTPAAKPGGHTVNLVYGGRPFSFCHWEGEGTAGLFVPEHHQHRTFYVCDLTAIGGSTMSNRFPLLSRTQPPNVTGVLDGWRISTFIDTFATIAIHENEHIRMYEMWKMGKTNERLRTEDGDEDGVPNDKEEQFGFDPTRKQTWLSTGETAKIKYDEEWLCYEAMRSHVPGSLDKHDWSHPGKQWP
ncbi:MAG: hypothetical protein CVU64_12940 [Deltaproteobacteria bacterium HGW-Deltaproteobacteria-21]|nr:MAG: hypothetical protein CVU64_12940 [Deltaproteobacteria bacterium HGW-Deltaproteobacteria-21]